MGLRYPYWFSLLLFFHSCKRSCNWSDLMSLKIFSIMKIAWVLNQWPFSASCALIYSINYAELHCICSVFMLGSILLLVCHTQAWSCHLFVSLRCRIRAPAYGWWAHAGDKALYIADDLHRLLRLLPFISHTTVSCYLCKFWAANVFKNQERSPDHFSENVFIVTDFLRLCRSCNMYYLYTALCFVNEKCVIFHVHWTHSA